MSKTETPSLSEPEAMKRAGEAVMLALDEIGALRDTRICLPALVGVLGSIIAVTPDPPASYAACVRGLRGIIDGSVLVPPAAP
jgi:hypothetical protein